MAEIDPRDRVRRQPDLVERTLLEVLARGPVFRVVRLVKGGPLCPSAILWVQTFVDPSEPTNLMDRSPFVVGLVSGQPVDPYRLFSSGRAGTSHIDRAEYKRLMAEIAANLRANRFDPRCAPYQPVDIGQIDIPFMEDAQHARHHQVASRGRRRTQQQPAAG